jgi:hypothetical protein
LTLVCNRQTVLRGQFTELFMGETHDYRMRIIIKQRGGVSTGNLSFDAAHRDRFGMRTNRWEAAAINAVFFVTKTGWQRCDTLCQPCLVT